MTSKSISANQGGFVSLVGAGPGDPDLLTVKALRLIQKAQVVVYDRLVSDEIMAQVNPEAELIYVGKRLDHHCVPQHEINQVLVEKAQQNKHVVRLKGGDPFIFGRGGEELEKLALEKISFEVVPGITAAAGCSAYAGIPLTHRDHAQSVHFITGHLKKEGMDIDWASLSKGNTTLVFYMGLKESASIQEKLTVAGLSKQTSVAIIERGTTANQRVLTGNLSQLSQIAEQAISPSLIIVGSVTSLHEKLHWFE
ncbi:uroporphyrinogen-III C-methyltransferase [Vibrio sp. UCD-FRSSP16_10]|uniref:uroporphyrinogen-III C-methyltransferase n=1 Tax=unclassified Vibrio TaxID=2614977 RepID=UPI0007FB8D37|nr:MULTISPECIES: uroporphyrinogen-III C-methyltransferase [unclassified Vibrio]OBT07944.1 uroporphyrinogen-III C-methyltransferase [Vibrio sp. UCD-FRSSP16_30]OBT17119.1 uroporphyrinogen-III C-methyltransferase [Vibrio sp. UCD-FRSSP16_10]